MSSKNFSISAPSPAVCHSLLVDLLMTPMAMRADRHGALVLSLVQQLSPKREAQLARLEFSKHLGAPRRITNGTDPDDEDDGSDVMPWEEPIYQVENGVAVVDVSGGMVKGYDAFTCWYWGCMSTDRLQDAVSALAVDPNVVAVIFKIGSPGGMATGIPEAGVQIAALAKIKLVVCVTDTMACSAAYWVACQASTFFTTVSADVGCIGTYIALYDYTAMLEEWGIKLELFKRGKYKALGVMGNPLDADARAFLDRDCGRTNDRFLAAVRSARGTVADETMQGQWFDGEEAVQLNLADSLTGSVGEVVASVREGVLAAMRAPFLS